jgi:hypothetical protein
MIGSEPLAATQVIATWLGVAPVSSATAITAPSVDDAELSDEILAAARAFGRAEPGGGNHAGPSVAQADGVGAVR